MHDLVIANGTVVDSGHSQVGDIAVDGGLIVEVTEPGAAGPSRETIDATDLLVLPGAVDVHFHCRAPSHPERGTFATETQAAAAGGVTTVLEMPISDPPCSTPAVLQARKELGERESHVDFGLFAGAALKTTSEAEAMVDAGAIAFKLFTHAPPPDRLGEFEGLWAASEDEIRAALEVVAPTGLRITVHAENQALIERFESEKDHNGHVLRPPEIEGTAISMLGVLAKETDARIHIAHMTSAHAVDALAKAKKGGAEITGETCPHYLALHEKHITQFGPYVKVAPPLRTPADNQTLWDAINEGVIDVVASDHAPFTPAEKQVPYDQAPRGIPGVELMLPMMFDAADRGLIDLETAVRVLSEMPAKLFGLYPKKGVIAAGSDADFVLMNTQVLWTVDINSLLSRSGGSAAVYDGMSLKGRVDRTMVRGTTVFLDGEIVGPSEGRFVRPLQAPLH